MADETMNWGRIPALKRFSPGSCKSHKVIGMLAGQIQFADVRKGMSPQVHKKRYTKKVRLADTTFQAGHELLPLII